MEETKYKVDLENYKYKNMYQRFVTDKNAALVLTGTFDISKVFKLKKKHSLNAMLCYCILTTGQQIEQFHYAIKEDGLYYYKNVKVNAVLNGKDGNLYYGDYRYFDNFLDFEKEYLRVNKYCSENCTHLSEDTGALLSTSAMIQFPFDSIVTSLLHDFWDSFFTWGAYKKKNFKTYLSITLRVHHAVIDGQTAGKFFKKLQETFNNFKI